jgi:crotonobetainyl-CoA:carnitine CoA-transferase CaiB-like acyl-CoA transferase
MAAAKVAYAVVNTVAELSAHPHLRRAAVQAPGGEVRFAAPAPQFRGEPRTYRPVPALGQHTEAVRAEFTAAPVR